MQISRHWRMNAQRYRLQGVRYENGEIRLVARHIINQVAEAPEARQLETKKPVRNKEFEPIR